MRNTLGGRLRAAREDADISQEKLARLIDMSYFTISSIENGLTLNPSWQTIVAIARELDISLDWLAADNEANSPAA